MTPAAAIKAYSTVSGNAFTPPAKGTEAGGFADMLQSAMQEVASSGAQSDKVSLQAATRLPCPVDVVTSVSETELNIQTVVALRDKVIEAYQQIMQMPM